MLDLATLPYRSITPSILKSAVLRMTSRRIADRSSAPLSSKQSPAAVTKLQLLLLTRGFPPGPIDGVLGPKTEHAVLRAAKAASLNHPTPAAIVAWLRTCPALPVIVPRVSTPVPSIDVVPALRDGHRHVFGEPLSGMKLRMAYAQLVVEHGFISPTDRGLRAVHTYNLGNVMTGRGYMGPWFEMTALERDKYGRMVPRKSQWRAAADAAEGAALYWGMLQRHFGKALAVMDDGDPASFAHELKNGGYYTATEGAYADLLTHCWDAVGAWA